MDYDVKVYTLLASDALSTTCWKTSQKSTFAHSRDQYGRYLPEVAKAAHLLEPHEGYHQTRLHIPMHILNTMRSNLHRMVIKAFFVCIYAAFLRCTNNDVARGRKLKERSHDHTI